MSGAKKRILLVEDDKSMGYLLKDTLENYGFELTHYTDGQSAYSAFKLNAFDLCLLDVMMPVMDGFTLAKKIRKISETVPIVFLTAKALKEDRIEGFKIGADDYVTKPFSVEELALRIKAILKRGVITPQLQPTLSFSECTLDITNLTLVCNNELRQLTQKEADLLALFIRNQNVLMKRAFILNEVWKDDNYFVGRSLDVFISKLRKYLKDDSNIQIVNIHGAGYRFEVKV